MISMHFNSYASLAIFFISFLFCSAFFFNMKIYMLYECQLSLIFITVRQLAIYLSLKTFNIRTAHFVLSLDFRPCSLYNNVNYSAQHVYKPLFGYSVVTCRLTCSEMFLSINEKKKLERSPGKGRTQYNLTNGRTALAQLYVLVQIYALYSDRALSFNPWQRALSSESIDCSLGLAIAYIYSDQLRANFVITRHYESNPKCYLSSCIVRTFFIFVRMASSHHLEKYYT